MTINVIVAVSDNGVIGKDGKIPWKLSTDLARFKEITIGNSVVMGRKTFESIGKGLENRDNLIISKSYFNSENNKNNICHRVYDPYVSPKLYLKDMTAFRSINLHISPSDAFIIGGQQIYDEIFKTPELIHRVYLTRVHCDVEGDTFFNNFPDPVVTTSDEVWWMRGGKRIIWKKIQQEFVPRSDKDEYDSTFQVWENRP